MALYTVDVRDQVIQRVTHRPDGVDNKRFLVIEARSAKGALAKARHALEKIASAVCIYCSHGHCHACEEYSVTRRYSDYWICHRCAELNPRVPNGIEGGVS